MKDGKHEGSVYDVVVLDVAKELALFIYKNEHTTYRRLCDKFQMIALQKKERLKEYLEKNTSEEGINIFVSTIHRIKGLEFDSVVIPASTYPIGFNNESMTDGEKNMEERRLMYVAFSRAKRRLYYYEGKRESSIRKNKTYDGEQGKAFAHDGESKVKIGYLAAVEDFHNINKHIKKEVKIDGPITLKWENNHWSIFHGDFEIGALSASNEFIRKLDSRTNYTGLFVKSVNIVDQDHEMYYTWSKEAIKQGYVYYIDYYGCINI